MKCFTCNRELKPPTSVPRLHSDTEGAIAFREKYAAQRAQEIAEGKLGYLGEGQFCNKDCAAFFGRATVHYMKHITIVPDASEQRIAGVGRLAQRIYHWVESRMK